MKFNLILVSAIQVKIRIKVAQILDNCYLEVINNQIKAI